VNDLSALRTGYRAQLQLTSSTLVAHISSRFQTIGAICESSRWLAGRLCGAMTGTTEDIVELGAGFGSVTRVLPDHAVSIERDDKRVKYLRQRFPNRAILDCCAVDFIASLERPATVISSIPNVNNPEFGRLRNAVAASRDRGNIIELITYTYFPHNPFGGIFSVEERKWLEFLNVPPAFVWRYTC
jgi:phospholipid N-methyltransferase